jgi:hypothetical protein
VLDGTWWAGTARSGSTLFPVPAKAGSFLSVLAKGAHWDGTKDEDVTVVFIGEGPATSTLVEETK